LNRRGKKTLKEIKYNGPDEFNILHFAAKMAREKLCSHLVSKLGFGEKTITTF
jgi:hypothetical protein